MWIVCVVPKCKLAQCPRERTCLTSDHPQEVLLTQFRLYTALSSLTLRMDHNLHCMNKESMEHLTTLRSKTMQNTYDKSFETKRRWVFTCVTQNVWKLSELLSEWVLLANCGIIAHKFLLSSSDKSWTFFSFLPGLKSSRSVRFFTFLPGRGSSRSVRFFNFLPWLASSRSVRFLAFCQG